jgi:nicotinate-nucleotide adenylyltransferase
MERIGLFGGTFDPLHVGHLMLASVAWDALELDRVWFVPVGDPPHKQRGSISPAAHRMTMLALSIAADERFEAMRIDIDRPGPHYSVDMITLAAAIEPAAAFHFLMGSDSLRDLPKWHAPERLITLCRLGVLRRPDAPVDPAELGAVLPGLQGRIDWIDGPQIALSSSEIRARVRAGLSVRYMVPEPVLPYINAHDLYR